VFSGNFLLSINVALRENLYLSSLSLSGQASWRLNQARHVRLRRSGRSNCIADLNRITQAANPRSGLALIPAIFSTRQERGVS